MPNRDVQPDDRRRPSLEAEALRVGPWRVEPRGHRLVHPDGTGVRVEPKVMDVLLCLARRPGEAVTREELLAAAWPGVIVGDDAVNSAVSKLRSALGSGSAAGGGEGGGGRRRYVETVPKVGYRLVAPVEWERPTPPAARALPHRSTPRHAVPGPATTRRRRRTVLAAALLAAVLLGAAAAAVLLFLESGAATGSGNGTGETSTPAPRTGPFPASRPLTAAAGMERDPALSPGAGAHLAYAAHPEGGDGAGDTPHRTAIWVRLLDGDRPLRLTPGPHDRHPAWSPDGTRVAYLHTLPGAGICEIRVVPSLGGPARQLGDCLPGALLDLDWSPDGRWLAYVSRSTPGGPQAVHLLAPADGTVRRLTDPPPDTLGDVAVAFSPDGTEVAFVRSAVEGVGPVWRQPVDGGAPRPVDIPLGLARSLDWTPDGRALILSAMGNDFKLTLKRVPLDGGAPEVLTTPGGEYNRPSVAADGRVAFESWRGHANLHRYRPGAGDAPHPLTHSTRWNWSPAFSPTGNRLAFVSDRSGKPEIWIAGSGGEEPQRHTLLEAPFLTHLDWSPRGPVVFALQKFDADLFRLDPDDGTVTPLTDTPDDEWVPRVSRDGRRLYFSTDRGGRWRLWSLPADGGAARPLLEAPVHAVRESADGRWLYYTTRRGDGLWRIPLRPLLRGEAASGDAQRVSHRVPAHLHRENWTLAGPPGAEVVWLAVDAAGERHLATLDPESGALTLRAPAPDLAGISGLAHSPATGALVFSLFDRREVDIYLLEGPLR